MQYRGGIPLGAKPLSLEAERRDHHIKKFGVFRYTEVRPVHRSDGARNPCAAVIGKRLAGLQEGLLTDDPKPPNFLMQPFSILNNPMPGNQLRPNVPRVLNRYEIRKAIDGTLF